MIILVCYNLKATNFYIFSLNQNQNVIKKMSFIIFKRYHNKKSRKTGTWVPVFSRAEAPSSGAPSAPCGAPGRFSAFFVLYTCCCFCWIQRNVNDFELFDYDYDYYNYDFNCCYYYWIRRNVNVFEIFGLLYLVCYIF